MLASFKSLRGFLNLQINVVSFLFLLSMLISSCGGQKEETGSSEEKYQLSTELLALKYLGQNQLDVAEAALKKMIKLDPKDAESHANLGLVYLREKKYDEAEAELQKALEIKPDNYDFLLILAELYRQSGNQNKAVETLKNILSGDTENAKALYMLSTIYEEDSASADMQKKYLLRLAELQPSNVVPRLKLADLLVQNGNADSCLAQLKALKQVAPEFPKEAEGYYNRVTDILKKGNTKEAVLPVRQFHESMKVTAAYSSGLEKIEGPQGELTGYPVFLTDSYRSNVLSQGENLMDIMEFSDATQATGLEIKDLSKADFSVVAVSDYDGDGDIDLYFSATAPGGTSSEFYLFNNEMGTFTDVKSAAGLSHKGKELAASFADLDNDGNVDLFISMENGSILYKNNGDGTFSNVSEEANLSGADAANDLLFADLDQDGDLDLYLARNGSNRFYRNNADGTYSETASEMKLDGGSSHTTGVDFGDLDDDGDLDLISANDDANMQLFTNHRHSNFEDIAASAGLKTEAGTRSVAIADYNNDGMLDIFVSGGSQGKNILYKNIGNNHFESDAKANAAFTVLKGSVVHDLSFLDFDNDGHQDILVAGSPAPGSSSGVFLFHNDTTKGFSDVSKLLPDNIKEGFGIQIADFNNDGDEDIFLAGADGIHLIRNENGNLHYYIDVQLVGLSYGSSKNNRFGIGAQVALRAGDLYQVKTVKEPVVHFGLGKKNSVDVMRIIWPNGVPQNIINPKSKEDLVEEQALKGSCPFLFTWNGEAFEFQKDMMWRSALGMPVAINGSDTIYSFADISTEYLKIPGEKLMPKDGKYAIKITEELWEAVFFDKASLIAVDHPDSVDFYVDERFVLPPFPDGELFKITEKHLPVSATDEKGANLLPEISKYDFQYISDFQMDKYQGLAKNHDLILDLGSEASDDKGLHLFLRGWIFPADASINVATTQSDKFNMAPPSLQVMNEQGQWQTVIQNLGFPMGKDKMVIANLSGKFLTKDRRVKIKTNMQIYWDHIFFAKPDEKAQARKQTLKMTGARLDFRGYSAMYRKGGRYGPHWFDYYSVSKGQKWRDLTGYYTRYGDVLPLLLEGDDQYIIANSGDEITMEFDAEHLPQVPDGWKRDFLIYSEGWVKDGDLNTAHGQTVKPLPYHGMKRYPYGNKGAYPSDEVHRSYQKKYNTRKVDTEDFKNALKPGV